MNSSVEISSSTRSVSLPSVFVGIGGISCHLRDEVPFWERFRDASDVVRDMDMESMVDDGALLGSLLLLGSILLLGLILLLGIELRLGASLGVLLGIELRLGASLGVLLGIELRLGA